MLVHDDSFIKKLKHVAHLDNKIYCLKKYICDGQSSCSSKRASLLVGYFKVVNQMLTLLWLRYELGILK
jgi:hypothetical protein